MPEPFRCRACGSEAATPVLSLGRTPLANALLAAGDLDRPEPTYPLELVFCERCTLVQITETVPPEQLFSDYSYFSSFSETMLRHAEALVGEVIRTRGLGASSLAVEIASNDGYLLQYYRREGVPVLGIEPAANVAAVAERHGVRTVVDFFGERLARRLHDEAIRADVIHANNVLAHVPDLPGFARGLALLLKEDGVAVIEVPYVKDLVDRCEFDTIYHEHLSYFSVTALDRLFGAHGLSLQHVEHLEIHGGSLRATVGCAGHRAASPSVVAALAREEHDGMTRHAYYARFADAVRSLRESLRTVLAEIRAKGQRIAAYGAAAKGSTLLNYAGIGREHLDFVVDRSPYKQGRFMPGVHLPIESPERLLERQPAYVLLLTWNFADEILEQQSEYRRRGGRFIVPVPDVRVV
ncbi:MAG: methyltransferase [Acidobacteria bacterium]|nr:MAG: methyltransferase [Acidobacteriota bacterium]